MKMFIIFMFLSRRKVERYLHITNIALSNKYQRLVRLKANTAPQSLFLSKTYFIDIPERNREID